MIFQTFRLSDFQTFRLSDFQIEGMSIGDSLLDYMTEEEILKEIEKNLDRYPYLIEPYKYVQINLYKDLTVTYII